jgi:hypothetical protein
LVSNQEVETHQQRIGAFVGFFGNDIDQTAHGFAAVQRGSGTFTISIRSTSEFNSDNPYTVDKLLTMGIPSIKTKVYGPSKPLIWMSPVLQTPQFSCGRTPFTFCKAS